MIRGNSATGKSSVAAQIRARYGRGVAVVSQDNLRRVVLREHDIPGGAIIGLILLAARHATAHGYHVLVEGILYADRYGAMLGTLVDEHPGPALAYYLEASFDETLLLWGSEQLRQLVSGNRCSSEALSWTLATATGVAQ